MHGAPWRICCLTISPATLSVNPIQDLERTHQSCCRNAARTILDVHSLNTLLRLEGTAQRRRALGLYTFMYATIHVSIFLDLDYGLSWSPSSRRHDEKPYIIFRHHHLLAIDPLAITSFDILEKTPQEELEAPAPDRLHDCAPGRPTLRLVEKGRYLPIARRCCRTADLRTDSADFVDPAYSKDTEILRLAPDPAPAPIFQESPKPETHRHCRNGLASPFKMTGARFCRNPAPVLFKIDHAV